MYWHEYSTNVQCVKVSGSVTVGFLEIGPPILANLRELFLLQGCH